MPKLSLITLHAVQNYGSVLQTYASQIYFERLGYDTEVVDYIRENNQKENLVDTYIRNSKIRNRNKFTRFIFRHIKRRELEERYTLFRSFVETYIHLTPRQYLKEADFEQHPIAADIYCTGSDQTWNSHWNRGTLTPFYLTYAREGALKIAYASSFGKNRLEKDERETIRDLLSSYDMITVREQEAVEILSDLGIASKRVLDPTLMLSREDWRNFADVPIVEGEYMLIYQLGYNKNFNRLAKQIAKEKKIKLIRIGFGSEARFYGGKVIINPEVRTFLSLLANAKYIITDSFHATSFAVNLNVNFFCWLPKVFSGRITDFLSLLGLENRVFRNYEELSRLFESQINFAAVNRKLEKERSRCAEVIAEMVGVRV